jgi:hypothetical protein
MQNPFKVGDSIVIYAKVTSQDFINRLCDSIFLKDDTLELDVTGILKTDLVNRQHKELLLEVRNEITHAYDNLSRLITN